MAQQILSLPDLTTSSVQRLLNQLPLDEDTRLGLYNELKFRSRHTSHEEVKRLEAAPALEFSARQIQGVLKRDTLMKLHLGSSEEKKPIAQEAGRYYVLQKNTDLRSGLGYTLSATSTTVSGQCDDDDDDNDEFEDVLPESDFTVYQAKVFDHEYAVKNADEDVSEEEDDTSEDGDLEQDYANFLEFEASTQLPPVDALYEDIPIKSKSLSPITSVDEGDEQETEVFPNSIILPPMIDNSIPKQVSTTPMPQPLASIPVQLPELKGSLIETKMEEEMERKVRRNAAAPDDITNSQIKQLLELFGIPFIVSPGEAEAQCVELERLGHCQAVSSIDGDVFIFGARRVIVGEIEYEAWRLSEEWGLNQDRLIDLAMLWGCDYAPGVEGVGLVLGLEILTNWKSLQEFKQWYTNGEDDTPEKASLRKKIRLTSDFPNERVRSAFENPLVDSASTCFVWGVPNLPGLKKYNPFLILINNASRFMGERVNMDPERLENSITSALSSIPRYHHHHHHHHQEASAKTMINKESNKSVRLLKALNKLKK